MEEVPNIASMVYPKTGTSYADAVVAAFKRNGYSAEFRILNAADHGVAQSRRRFFLVARRGKHESVFPQLKKGEHIPVSRVISPPYQPVSEYAASLVRSKKKRWAYTVLNQEKPSPTVTTQFNGAGTWNVVETDDGYATIGVKNGLRIQGFPDSWKLTDKVTKNYILIGNAVPPPLAKAVLSSLK
jgi:DNA (cytosine-5)-methyltransferase 1